MLASASSQLKPTVLIIDTEIRKKDAHRHRALQGLVLEFSARGIAVVQSANHEDGRAAFASDSSISCLFVSYEDTTGLHAHSEETLHAIRKRNATVPIFLMTSPAPAHAFHARATAKHETLPTKVMGLVTEFVWIPHATPSFVVGRASVAIKLYLDNVLPPFTKALLSYFNKSEYSWAAPGHKGGLAFTKTPAGRFFFDFFGENLFRTDGGIERAELGSLLEHSGVIGEAEKYAARVFGAHRTFSVLNGTSSSNRTIMSAVVQEGRIALCDRNCHKSIEQGLAISGGIPVFLTAGRNRYGVIGPVPQKQFEPDSIAAMIGSNELAKKAKAPGIVYAVVTNCTYDGMCYNAADLQRSLERSVDRIHFDEAWFGYARFHESMYKNRHALHGEPSRGQAGGEGRLVPCGGAPHIEEDGAGSKRKREEDGEEPACQPATIFVTHSTHKTLAALSQTSYIHIRNGRRPIDFDRFNESYMAQATTSPLYPLIAANEVAAAMMDGPSGRALIQEAVCEAVDFRQALAHAHKECARGKKPSWFFKPWNSPQVDIAGETLEFEKAPVEELATNQNHWMLRGNEHWHGFDLRDDPEGWCMLDPLKVGIVCPGLDAADIATGVHIPGVVVSLYLQSKYAIVPARTMDFMILCMFSIGDSEGKWGTLISALLAFKADYDADTPLVHLVPSFVALAPQKYEHLGLKGLCNRVFEALAKPLGESGDSMGVLEEAALRDLPTPVITPREAHSKLVGEEVELLSLEEMKGRTLAIGVVPYPPGIPLIMPGEKAEDKALLYLRALEKWGQDHPGLEKVVEGVSMEESTKKFRFWCIKDE